MLVMTGYHDSQVQYWEPAKYVAKLRDVSTSGHPVLLRTDMDAGHSGASGRFQALKDRSYEFGFLIKMAES
jgi:oligopeptidase B